MKASVKLQNHLSQVELERLTYPFFDHKEFVMMHRNNIMSRLEHENIILELCLLHDIRSMHLLSS